MLRRLCMVGLAGAALAACAEKPAPPMTVSSAELGKLMAVPHGVRILRNGREIEITGPIVFGQADALELALDEAPRAHLVHLDSTGGQLTEALKVAQIVEHHKLDTYVRKVCASACTLVFLSGEHRWVGPHAVLAFHEASLDGQVSDVGNLVQRKIFAMDKISPAFVQTALSTPPDAAWQPSVTQLVAAGVVNGIAPDTAYGMSGFGPNPTPEKAIAALDDIGSLATWRQNDPHWDQVEQAWARAIMDGHSLAEFQPVLTAHLQEVSRRTGMAMPAQRPVALPGEITVLLKTAAKNRAANNHPASKMPALPGTPAVPPSETPVATDLLSTPTQVTAEDAPGSNASPAAQR